MLDQGVLNLRDFSYRGNLGLLERKKLKNSRVDRTHEFLTFSAAGQWSLVGAIHVTYAIMHLTAINSRDLTVQQ